MSHRFFIPPEWLTPPLVHLRGETAHQIKRVLRMQAGEKIIVLDNSGTEWRVTLTGLDQDAVRGEITDCRPAEGEPRVRLTLYQAALKAQKFEWVLQKGTELGVSRFVPVTCRRSLISRDENLAGKQARWQRIIQEAAEQSGRGRLPLLAAALSLAEALDEARQSPGLAVMAWEEGTGVSLKEVLRQKPAPAAVALFIGPEGGFTPEEADLARQAGIPAVKVGPRILRTETAGLAIGAAILYELGEWG